MLIFKHKIVQCKAPIFFTLRVLLNFENMWYLNRCSTLSAQRVKMHYLHTALDSSLSVHATRHVGFDGAWALNCCARGPHDSVSHTQECEYCVESNSSSRFTAPLIFTNDQLHISIHNCDALFLASKWCKSFAYLAEDSRNFLLL